MNGRVLRYALILHSIALIAKDCAVIASEVGATERGVRVILDRMRALGLAHVEGKPASRWNRAQWRLGSGMGNEKRPIRPGVAGADLVTFASLIRALQQPHRAKELIGLVGVQPLTMHRMLRACREANIAFRCGWQRVDRSSDWIALWQFGLHCADVQKPPAKDRAEQQRKYRRQQRERLRNLAVVRELSTSSSIFNSRDVRIPIEAPCLAEKRAVKATPPRRAAGGLLDPHCVLRDPMASPAMVAWARAELSVAA